MLPIARPLLCSLVFLSACSTVLGDSTPNAPTGYVPLPDRTTYTAQETDNGKIQKVRVIVFDANPPGLASSPYFVQPLPALEASAPAEIRVYNLNSFTNVYDISFCREDFHGGGMPSALGNLVVASHESIARAVPATDTNSNFSSPKLRLDYEQFQLADAQYHKLIDPINNCAKSITQAIEDPSGNNIAIRIAATTAVWKLFQSDTLPAPHTITDGELVSSTGQTVAVTDYGPDDQPALTQLLQDLRDDAASSQPQIAAAEASMKTWSDQWAKDYLAAATGTKADNPPPAGNAPAAPAAAQPDANAAPPGPAAYDAQMNGTLQQEEAFAEEFKEGQDVFQAVLTIFNAAIDPTATPPYAVIHVDSLPDADVAEAQVTVSNKPPTGNFAQVDLDNARIGIPGGSSKTYTADTHVYGRNVLDFSGGIVLSTLQNKNYYLDSSNKVRQGPSDDVDITFGVLATYYKTQKSGLSVGPSLGVSVGSSTRYLLGLSLIQTIHRSRLLLTVGGASGYVNQLGDGDTVNQVAPNKNIATNSVQRFGGFVGLTWSIFVE